MRRTPRILRSFERQRSHKEATFGVIVLDAKENGKLLMDLPWDRETSRFADVIGAVVPYIEAAHQGA